MRSVVRFATVLCATWLWGCVADGEPEEPLQREFAFAPARPAPVIITENLRVEVSWDNGSDIDAHLLHPSATDWYQEVLDCNSSNCLGNGIGWGADGATDDPRLDTDDVDGFGPENIVIDQPELSGKYRVGAYYVAGTQATDVTVRIWCGGVAKAQLTRALNGQPALQLWKVADVEFTTASTCNVIPIDGVVAMDRSGVPR